MVPEVKKIEEEKYLVTLKNNYTMENVIHFFNQKKLKVESITPTSNETIVTAYEE